MPHLPEQPIKKLDAIIKPADDFRGHIRCDDLEIDLGGSEDLANLVVQLPREMTPLFFLNMKEPARENPKLIIRVFQIFRSLFARGDVAKTPHPPDHLPAN